jgi:TRAP-type transport system periplasmic protein
VMSQKVYDGLPPQAQKALDEVGRSYPATRQPLIEAVEAKYRTVLEDAGIVFNEVDKTAFIDEAKKVPDQFPEWTPGLYEQMLDVIK